MSDDWLREFLSPGPQPHVITSITSSPQPLNTGGKVQVQVPVLAPLTPVKGTVEDLANGIRQMSLTQKAPTFFAVGGEASEGSSSGPPAVTPDIATALHQMAAGVTALAQSMGGGTLPSAKGPVITGDPHFPAWDGQPASLLGWISDTTQLKEIRNLTDDLAIRYARLKLESKLQGVYPTENAPETWAEFTTFLKDKFFPSNWSLILRLLLQGQKMVGNDFPNYLALFRRMCKEIPDLDERTAQAAFVQGLSPYLRYEVLRDWQDGQGKTEEMIRKAWAAHNGLAPFGWSQWDDSRPHWVQHPWN